MPPKNTFQDERFFEKKSGPRRNVSSLDKRHAMFRKPSNYYTPRYMHDPNVTCHYCCRIGHISPVCYARHRHMSQRANCNYTSHHVMHAHKSTHTRNKHVVTNKKGPKWIWVPKSSN